MTLEMPSGPPREKLASIQVLRALAAATVALSHIFFAFARHVGDGFGFAVAPGSAGQGAVMLFFIVSGYVITISARSIAGTRDAARVFWIRRAVRIMPPYWIASFAFLAVLTVFWNGSVDVETLGLSLLLVPFAPEEGGLRYTPFLWPGWTLFYEMVFYALFGLLLTVSRRAAIAGAAAGLIALVLGGMTLSPAAAQDAPIAWSVTRPVLLMFLPGIALALLRERGWRAPVSLRLAALIACPVFALMVPQPVRSDAMGFDYLAWCGLPALLLAFAVLAGPLRVPARRWVNRAGDASYALYLFHVPVVWAWLWFYPMLPFFKAGAWDFFVTASAAAFVTAGVVFAFVERPITARLNRLLATKREPVSA